MLLQFTDEGLGGEERFAGELVEVQLGRGHGAFICGRVTYLRAGMESRPGMMVVVRPRGHHRSSEATGEPDDACTGATEAETDSPAD